MGKREKEDQEQEVRGHGKKHQEKVVQSQEMWCGRPVCLVQVIASLGEPRMTTGGVNLVVGFRPSLWARVAPEETPAGVTDFDQEVRGIDGYTMPATQHDLWVWAAGHAYYFVPSVEALRRFASMDD